MQTRLRGVFDLPASTFKEENANVLTSVIVFGEGASKRPFVYRTVESFEEPAPDLELLDPQSTKTRQPDLRHQLLDASEPSITLPVAGNRTVRIALDGRKVKLRYFCGLTQAMVGQCCSRQANFLDRASQVANRRTIQRTRQAGHGGISAPGQSSSRIR